MYHSDMQENVEKQVNKAIDSCETEKAISQHIKKFFDTKYGPNWHCCVGKQFASGPRGAASLARSSSNGNAR